MRLDRRIRALEARLITVPVILRFIDGSTRELRGSTDFLLRLFQGACGGADLSPVQVEQLDLIHHSICAEEPGGGHMVELIQALLSGPVEERGNR